MLIVSDWSDNTQMVGPLPQQARASGNLAEALNALDIDHRHTGASMQAV